MDITKTNYKDGSFDLGICLSVLEHGVCIDKFFKEMSRILKNGSYLFITTDYWIDETDLKNSEKVYGLDWIYFTKETLQKIVEKAKQNGFVLFDQDQVDFEVKNKCIIWNNNEYTFACLIFIKQL